MQLVSIIVPVHNEEKNVGELCRRIKHAIEFNLQNFSHEIILVDDASTDTTWQEIIKANRTDPSVAGLRLRNSIGQHPAIALGLQYATGDFVVVMDGDLQDIPEAIPAMTKKIESGFDAVYARKSHKQVPLIKSFFSAAFNHTMKYLLGYRQVVNSTFCVVSKQVAETIGSRSFLNRYFPVAVAGAARTIGFVDIPRPPRIHGKSNYSLTAQLSLALDALASGSKRIFKIIIICQTISMLFIFIGLASTFSISFVASLLFTVTGTTGAIGTALLNHKLRARALHVTDYEITDRVKL
jgi:dolichol-phosphate mannosyltransferase